MSIAVDPRVIPMGSRVLLIFNQPGYQQYNGVYTARDTGRLIKGHKIDLFMGDFGSNAAHRQAINFGRLDARAIILPQGA